MNMLYCWLDEHVSWEVRVESDLELTSCSIRGGLKCDGLFCSHLTTTQLNYMQSPIK